MFCTVTPHKYSHTCLQYVLILSCSYRPTTVFQTLVDALRHVLLYVLCIFKLLIHWLIYLQVLYMVVYRRIVYVQIRSMGTPTCSYMFRHAVSKHLHVHRAPCTNVQYRNTYMWLHIQTCTNVAWKNLHVAACPNMQHGNTFMYLYLYSHNITFVLHEFCIAHCVIYVQTSLRYVTFFTHKTQTFVIVMAK